LSEWKASAEVSNSIHAEEMLKLGQALEEVSA
jgi:hypothetical protein